MNIRQKGANGEREIYHLLNPIVKKVMIASGGFSQDDIDNPESYIQRNQNQSAVGGKDLVNTFGLAIEVKRQETLSIDAWWRQTVISANKLNEKPILLYRQNRRKWKCVMENRLNSYCSEGFVDRSNIVVRVEISEESFLLWFEDWIKNYILFNR